jgi:hypothetical protein
VVDVGIKKATILGKDLPPIFVRNTSDVGQYYLRFRVISEDRSRRSAYSPINIVNAQDISGQALEYQYYSDASSFRINWTVPSIVKSTRFDVYARWSDSTPSGAYTFIGTVSGAQATLDIPATNKANVQVRVQVETSPHIINNPATVF